MGSQRLGFGPHPCILLETCVTLGKSLPLSGPQSSILSNGYVGRTGLEGGALGPNILQ